MKTYNLNDLLKRRTEKIEAMLLSRGRRKRALPRDPEKWEALTQLNLGRWKDWQKKGVVQCDPEWGYRFDFSKLGN